MKLEEALKLKKGDIVKVSFSSVAPERLTEGKNYELQGNASPLYRSELLSSLVFGFPLIKRSPDELPCNANFPIIDDNGRLKEACYVGFEIAKTY